MELRLFTVDEANRLLVQLEITLGRLRRRREALLRVLVEIEVLQTGADEPQDGSDRSAQISSFQRDVERRRREIAALSRDLRAMGIVVRDPDAGLVDFPAVVNGSAAYLCWRIGEREVAHWHGPDEGFAGRQPLPT